MSSELLKRIVSSLILLPLVIFIIIYNNIIFILFLIICLIISLYEWISMKKNKIINFVGLFFLFFTFFLAYQLRYELVENYTYFWSKSNYLDESENKLIKFTSRSIIVKTSADINKIRNK